MYSLTAEKISEYYQLGLIPGPDETEEEFLKRAQFCLDLPNQ